MPASGNINISGSTNYEVSADNITFGAAAFIPYTGSTITNIPVYVRLKAGLGIGSFNGETIGNTGGGVPNFNVTCNGNVTCAISINALGTAYIEDFNSLANTSTSSSLPCGWYFAETGSNANSTYTAGTGSSNTGDTYSFGSASSTERAFGTLQSSNLIPVIGAQYKNNTGDIINSLSIQYTGEQWRLGTANRGSDRLDFQISFNATSLTDGNWYDYNSLDFSSPITTGTPDVALDGNAAPNRMAVSSSLSGASIPNGSIFWIRWSDYDATNADDGLAVDDFSITAANTCMAPTVQASNLAAVSPNGNTINLSWTNGNGYKRIVIINTVNSFTNPVNGTDPSAFVSYSGSGEQVVYNGSGNSCTITDLIPNTQYCFRVYEFNCSDANTLFLTTTETNNPICFTTPNCGVTVSSYTPNSGPAGTRVSITGSNMTSGTTVSFNGSPAFVSYISASLIIATVPGGATSGPIKVSDGCNTIIVGLFTVIDISCSVPASDLFISEYVEGSSTNKAIEIANFTGSAKSLSGYSIEMYFNGSGTSTSVPLQNISLENNQVWVIAPSNASAALKSHANQISTVVGWFNGNDAVVLQNGTNKIDIFGNIGCDPGTAWTGSGFQTNDKTLVRNSNILSGITTNPGGSCPFPTLTTEWTQFSVDDFTHLGSHTVDNSGSIAIITTQPISTSVCTGSVITLTLVATGATSYQWKYFNGTNWVNVVDEAGVYSGAQTSTLTITGATGLNETQYYCEVKSSATCMIASNVAQLKVGDIWIGSSSDWNSDANWCTGAKPNQSTDVIIPTSPTGTNMPKIISSTQADCRNLEIQPGATITIETDATKSGSLIINGSSSGTGTITYNRYLETNKWYILSSPVYNSNNQTTFTDANLDFVSSAYNIADLLEASNTWNYRPSLAFPLISGKGYLAKLKAAAGNIISFTGTPNNTLNNVAVQSTGTYLGWNAVGNPFTSALKISDETSGFLDVNSSKLEDNYAAIYLWSSDASNYITISKSAYTPKYGFSNLSTETAVQAGQGFLINVKKPQSAETGFPNGTVSRTITFDKGTSGMQVHSTGTTIKRTETSWLGITLLASAGDRTRSTIVAFNPGMTTGLDPSYDAGLLSVSDFNVYTRLVAGNNETNFAIQCLPDNRYDSLVVPVGLDMPQAGLITFKADGVILPDGVHPVIEDRLDHISTPLKTPLDSLSAYLAEPGWGTGRFYLHFGSTASMVGIADQEPLHTLRAGYSNQEIAVFGAPEAGSLARLFDVNGRMLGGEYRLTSDNINRIPARGLKSGIYLLRIDGKTYRQTLKITVLDPR